MNVDVDDYTTEAKTQLPRPVRTSLPRDVLLGGAEFALKRGDRLSREDFTFARGMAALLREGRTLTPRQHDRLVVLVAGLLAF